MAIFARGICTKAVVKMRAYHLLSERWAIEALKKQRLKVSLFNDMNDPFELLGVALTRKEDRLIFQRIKQELNGEIGALCFSKRWSNPVLWSHYADKHRGICLGFDLLDGWVQHVEYRGTRLEEDFATGLVKASKEDIGIKLLKTKFEHWRYEEEVRFIVKLKDIVNEGPNYFLPFCNALQLPGRSGRNCM